MTMNLLAGLIEAARSRAAEQGRSVTSVVAEARSGRYSAPLRSRLKRSHPPCRPTATPTGGCSDPLLRGNVVPDAWIATTHGARVATADRGFARFPGVDTFDPVQPGAQ